MGLQNLVGAILDYEPGISSEIVFRIKMPQFKPETTNELQIAVNLWCSDRSKALKKYGHISNWDVSDIHYMDNLFYCVCNCVECCCGKQQFNDNINHWDVSKVVNMRNMFNECKRFNQPLDKWDMKNVRDIRQMFYGCHNFQQDISDWDMSNIYDDLFIHMAFDYTKCTGSYQPQEYNFINPVLDGWSPMFYSDTNRHKYDKRRIFAFTSFIHVADYSQTSNLSLE